MSPDFSGVVVLFVHMLGKRRGAPTTKQLVLALILYTRVLFRNESFGMRMRVTSASEKITKLTIIRVNANYAIEFETDLIRCADRERYCAVVVQKNKGEPCMEIGIDRGGRERRGTPKRTTRPRLERLNTIRTKAHSSNKHKEWTNRENAASIRRVHRVEDGGVGYWSSVRRFSGAVLT